MWQDYAIMIIQWLFAVALIPAVISKDKPSKWASLSTGSLLITMSVIFSTLNLWWSTISCGVVALVWFTLYIQKLRQELRDETSN